MYYKKLCFEKVYELLPVLCTLNLHVLIDKILFGVTWTEVVLVGNLSISFETDIMSADSEAVEI